MMQREIPILQDDETIIQDAQVPVTFIASSALKSNFGVPDLPFGSMDDLLKSMIQNFAQTELKCSRLEEAFQLMQIKQEAYDDYTKFLQASVNRLEQDNKSSREQRKQEKQQLNAETKSLQAGLDALLASFKRRNKCYILVLLRDASQFTTSKTHLSKHARDLLIKFASQNVPQYNKNTAAGDGYLLCTIKIAVLAEQSAERMNALKEIFEYAHSEPCEFDDESDEEDWMKMKKNVSKTLNDD